MKYLLLLLLLPFAATAQKDFDYTVNTTKCLMTIDNTDSLHQVTWFRKIQKKADVLKIISLTNTADCITLHLHYIGYSTDTFTLTYTDDAQEIITINPLLPLVVIGRTRYY